MKRQLMEKILLSVFLGILGTRILTVLAGEDESNAPIKSTVKNSGCMVDQAILEDLSKVRDSNEVKRKELVTKASELKAREDALAEEFKKLKVLREDIAKSYEAKTKENEEKILKLVETFLTMSPKAAAKVLSTLDDDLAVATLSQMDTARLAKIMNLMDSVRSTKLSELMAGVVHAKRSLSSERKATMSRDMDGYENSITKGGDKNERSHEQRNVSGPQPSSG